MLVAYRALYKLLFLLNLQPKLWGVSKSIRHSIGCRIQALTLLFEGFKADFIKQKTDLSPRAQQRLRKKENERGFRPEEDPRILEKYMVDGKRTGRLKTVTKATEQALLASAKKDQSGREKSSEVLAYELNIPLSAALRILKKHNLRPVKATRKPGFSKAAMEALLVFADEHKDWTLED